MTWRLFPLLFFAAGAFSFAVVHKYYVSTTTIDYKPQQGALQISMEVFTDDIEDAIDLQNKVYLRLGTDREAANSNELLFSYLKRHFRISSANEQLDFKWIGKEVEIETTWMYLEVTGLSNIEELSIENSVLTEVFPEQVNVVNFNFNNDPKSLILRKGMETGTIPLH